MSWGLRSVIGLALVGLLLAGCGLTGSVRPEVRAGVGDHGREMELEVGQSLVIALESNPTTGYQWAFMAEFDESVLKMESHRYDMGREAREKKLVGAGGEEFWYFKALSKGRTRLNLGYHRPWEEGVPPIKAFAVSVVVR